MEIAAGATIVINPIPAPFNKTGGKHRPFRRTAKHPEARPDKTTGTDGNQAGCFEAQSLHNENGRERQ